MADLNEDSHIKASSESDPLKVGTCTLEVARAAVTPELVLAETIS